MTTQRAVAIIAVAAALSAVHAVPAQAQQEFFGTVHVGDDGASCTCDPDPDACAAEHHVWHGPVVIYAGADDYVMHGDVAIEPSHALGQTCTDWGQCLSGFCACGSTPDAPCELGEAGVCCDRACEGGCETCASGTCTTMTAEAECRPAMGACDVAEVCDGTSLTCPPDTIATAGTECDPFRGSQCDGVSGACATAMPAGYTLFGSVCPP